MPLTKTVTRAGPGGKPLTGGRGERRCGEAGGRVGPQPADLLVVQAAQLHQRVVGGRAVGAAAGGLGVLIAAEAAAGGREPAAQDQRRGGRGQGGPPGRLEAQPAVVHLRAGRDSCRCRAVIPAATSTWPSGSSVAV